jgi:outer membrane protein assembly factor BamA
MWISKQAQAGVAALLLSGGVAASDGNKFAFAPVFAYDPVFETILGAALFSYPDEDQIKPGEKIFRQGFFMGTFDGYVRLAAIENRTYQDQRQRKLVVSLNNFFDYEFPEGSDEYERFDRLQASIGSEWSFPLKDRKDWSWFYGVRLETEQHDRDGDFTKGYPSIGIQRDRRDRSINTSAGDMFSTRTSVLPDALHSQSIGDPGWLVQADYRHYQAVFSESVLASRIEAEASDGKVFTSSLGGSNQLRGYVNDRYEGDAKLAGQLELRFPIWKWISGATFIETGTLQMDGDWETLTNGGLGLRFGLPPDGAMKLRFDYGIAENGDSEVYVNFNQAF